MSICSLVSGGALKIIKVWLEICLSSLSKARQQCIANSKNTDGNKGRLEVSVFMKTFGTTYELLCNTTAALLYISGGSDCRFESSFNVINNSYKSVHDYIFGWIDAQILAEGLPGILVGLISTSIEDFLSFSEFDDNYKSRVTRSVLPAVVGMHLSQVLYQLSSRMQNRQQLVSTKIPVALCTLFESICSHTKYVNNRETLNNCNHVDDIFTHIFEFGGVYYNEIHSHGQQNIKACAVCHDWDSGGDLVSLYSTSIDDKNHNRLSFNPRFSNSSEAVRSKDNHSPITTIDHNQNMTLLIASITSACLDSLTYFFADEVAKNTYNSADSTLIGQCSPLAMHETQQESLCRIMRNLRIVDSILFSASLLPRGAGRLSTIRLISTLSESPETLAALYEGSIIDVLVLISSEADEIQHQKLGMGNKSNSVSHEMFPSESLSNLLFIAKPAVVERNISGASTLSAVSSSNNSHYRNMKSYTQGSSTPTPLIGNIDGSNDDDDKLSEIATEETLMVCYSLANLCQSKGEYALRMFHSGVMK